MKTADLIEYMGMLVDMEKEIKFQEDSISSIQRELQELESCQMKRYTEPKPPADENSAGADTRAGMVGVAFLCALGFICLLSGSSGVVFGIVFIVIGMVIFLQDRTNENKKSGELKEEWIRYKKEKEAYADSIAHEKKQAEERIIKKSILDSNLQELESVNEKSKETLQELYSANIVVSKYRNLVMICSLYEYLSLGICKTLEGFEGAYRLVEEAIRIDHVITRLDRVIVQLEGIRENQFTLYSAIQESNQKFAKIMESTEQMADTLQKMHLQGEELNKRIAELQKTSELNTYQIERTKKELHYMNRMKYFAGEYDNPIIFESPPSE